MRHLSRDSIAAIATAALPNVDFGNFSQLSGIASFWQGLVSLRRLGGVGKQFHWRTMLLRGGRVKKPTFLLGEVNQS